MSRASTPDEEGAYVQAWVWVPREEVDKDYKPDILSGIDDIEGTIVPGNVSGAAAKGGAIAVRIQGESLQGRAPNLCA